jgi:hypothetical protein
MKTGGFMREVGVIKAPSLVRFGRNQRRAALVAPRCGDPTGIKRFKTWEEFTSWRTKSRTKD